MKRELVVVRDAEGKPVLLRVCEVRAGVVFVASDSALERIDAGDPNIHPVGFRRECVFNYDGPLPPKIDWQKMKPWTPS